MSTQNQLNINQWASLIATTGDQVTYIIEGHSGSGKSALLGMVGSMPQFAGHRRLLVDCTTMDVGDIQIPAVDHITKTSTFYPNSIFGTHLDTPVIVMLDEFGKVARPVQNSLLPLLLERRIGAYTLPAGSIVFGTTNLGAEGVGDAMQMHSRNRVSVGQMRKSTADEWLVWAAENDVNPAVMAWVHETPQVFQSFEEVVKPGDNDYIFHPKEQRKAFVTGRSLYHASKIIDKRADVNDDFAVQHAISGAIGVRGGADLMAFVTLADKLPRWRQIVEDPENCRVADSPAAMVMAAFTCVHRVEKDTFDNVMKYVQRTPKEMQALFATSLGRVRAKQGWAAQNRAFSAWVSGNSWLL